MTIGNPVTFVVIVCAFVQEKVIGFSRAKNESIKAQVGDL